MILEATPALEHYRQSVPQAANTVPVSVPRGQAARGHSHGNSRVEENCRLSPDMETNSCFLCSP